MLVLSCLFLVGLSTWTSHGSVLIKITTSCLSVQVHTKNHLYATLTINSKVSFIGVWLANGPIFSPAEKSIVPILYSHQRRQFRLVRNPINMKWGSLLLSQRFFNDTLYFGNNAHGTLPARQTFFDPQQYLQGIRNFFNS